MASLITCPHCGIRPKEEFSIRGDASVMRPAAGAAPEAWHAYVNLRDNVRGVMREHWQHSGGCRRWLVVERDTFSHDVLGVSDASKTPVQAKAEKPPVAGKAAMGAAKPSVAPKPPVTGKVIAKPAAKPVGAKATSAAVSKTAKTKAPAKSKISKDYGQ